ncbi:MAG: hypothetical protein LC803_07730 [Acidobacteria bacterium]|nr:hypothetical protein [Acidobacteriota bacterium]
MHRHKKILPLLLVVFAVTVLSTLAALPTQERETSPERQSAGENQHPVADYAATESTDPEKRAQRRARSKRYDKQSWVREPHPQSGGGDVKRLDSWMREVAAFPTATSDAVVIGETIDAQAYLSNDKSGVYTEFTVRVDEILKDDAAAPLAVGGTLAAQREGGRVRFPSGRIQRYKRHFQGMPRAGRRYVLFLKRNEDGEAYYTRTGYELRAGRVRPLDGVEMNKGASEIPQFAAYKDADEVAFLSALRDAVAKSLQASPE